MLEVGVCPVFGQRSYDRVFLCVISIFKALISFKNYLRIWDHTVYNVIRESTT